MTNQTISRFKADFAELLAKYDAEIRLQEQCTGYYSYPSGVIFCVRTGEFEHEDVDVGLWRDKDNI